MLSFIQRFIALIITFIILVFSYSGWMLLLAGIFLGIAMALIIIYRLLPLKCHLTNKYGIATSTYFYWFRYRYRIWVHLLLGTVYSGFISYTEVYIIMAIVAKISCTVLYFIVHGRKLKHN